jgi:hypothetical protein
MRLSRESDPTRKKAGAAYYRDKARAMRDAAARTKFPDTREQLLWIASQYEKLAEHAQGQEPQEAASAPSHPEKTVRTE